MIPVDHLIHYDIYIFRTRSFSLYIFHLWKFELFARCSRKNDWLEWEWRVIKWPMLKCHPFRLWKTILFFFISYTSFFFPLIQKKCIQHTVGNGITIFYIYTYYTYNWMCCEDILSHKSLKKLQISISLMCNHPHSIFLITLRKRTFIYS